MKTTPLTIIVRPAAIMLDGNEIGLIIAYRFLPDRQKDEMRRCMEAVAHAFGNLNPVMYAGGVK
jgi:hypothetical protein